MKKVYLIIPVYNVEQYLDKCLKSVFNQTYKNIDVICVNDGSTDNSSSILLAYKDKYSNLYVIEKENGGLSSARNAGLDYINDQNSYVMFLDSDDWIADAYIEKLVELLEQKDADIVCSKYYSLHEGEEEEIDEKEPDINVFNTFEGVEALFNAKIQSHGPCKLYKASLWNDIRYDESIMFLEDQSTVFKAFLKSKTIIQTTYQGYYYFHRLGSICQSHMSNKKILSALRSYFYVYNYEFNFNKDENKKVKAACFGLFLNAFLMLYPRFNFDNSSKDEINEMNSYINAINTNRKIIRKCKIKFKARLKLLVYRFSKKLYLNIYKRHLKDYD